LLFVCLAALSASPAVADRLPTELGGKEGVRDDRPLVYSASKRLESADEAAAIVQVVSARELWDLGYRTINEALQHLSGFEIISGRRDTLTLTRGLPSSVLVLIDGISIISGYDNVPGTALDFGTSLLFVDHIELVTSPGGVLWGANTFMGVINIVTRSAASVEGLRVVGGGGSMAYGEGGVLAAARYGRFELVLSASATTIRKPSVYLPDSAYADFERGNSGFTQSASEYYVDLLGKVTFVHQTGEYTLLVRYPFTKNYSAISERGALLPPSFLVHDIEPRRLYALHWKRWFLDRQLQLRAQVRYLDTPEDWFNALYPTSMSVPQGRFYRYQISGRRVGFDLEARLFPFKGNDLVVGTDYSFEHVSDATVTYNLGTDTTRIPLLPDLSQQVLGVFAHDQQRLAQKITLGAGVRYQKLSLFNDVVLASGQAVIGPLAGMSLKANYSEGVRTPQLWAALGTSGLYVRPGGPPGLERSRAAQVQLTGTPLRRSGPIDSLRAGVGYTFSAIDGLLVYSPASTGQIVTFVTPAASTLTFHSIDADLEVRASRGRAWLRATYNSLPSSDQPLTGPLLRAASWVINGGAAVSLWPRRHLWLQTAVIGLGPVTPGSLISGGQPGGSSPYDLQPRNPVALLEAGLTVRELFGSLDLGVFGRNLAGVSWAQPNLVPVIPGGIPQAGRSIYARVAWNWR
jgi:iron complex outermembrane receptor protein